MYELSRILVATDFSESSMIASRAAKRLSELFGCALHFVHVVEQLAGYQNIRIDHDPTPSMLRTQATEARVLLSEFLDVLEYALPDSQRHLRVGRPHEEIVRAANSVGADMIILGTRGQSNMARALLGSAAEKVISSTNIPVLSLHEEPEFGPGMRFVVATDMSESSRRAVSLASAMAERLDGQVILLSVLQPPSRVAFWTTRAASDVERAREKLSDQLESLGLELIKGGVSSEKVTRVGNAHVEIVKAAKEVKANLLLMGVHGQSGFADWLMGNVVQRVLHESPVPMVTVRG